jgi:glycosyltransferase involved in cell wall biosynthesis
VPTSTVRLLRRAATAVIVHGPGLARDLAATGIRPPAGIHVVAHPVLDRHVRLAAAVGADPRPPAASSDGGPRLLFFGRVMAYKGLAVLLAAADRLVERYPGLVVTVAGTGPELDRLRPELDRRPWFVVRDAYVPDAEVAGLFRAADVLVLPYIEASQSGVAALAAAFGTPVVASDVGELGEIVRSTGMGVVVPPADPGALAAALGQLIDAPDQRARYAAAAMAAGEGVMAPATVAARTLEVYAAARRGAAR